MFKNNFRVLDADPAGYASSPSRCISLLPVAVIFFVFGAAFAALPTYTTPGPDEMRVHFIDVGQGSAVLLEFSCGAALIDTGGEKNSQFDGTTSLERYLDAFFARREDLSRTLQLVVITHPHIDHTRGVSTVMNSYQVSNLVDNGLELGSGGRQQRFAHRRVRASDGKIRWQAVREAQVVSLDGFTNDIIDPIDCAGTDPIFSVFWGALEQERGWSSRALNNGNNSSVVVRVEFGEARFLFAGDIEEDVQPDLVDWFSEGCAADSDVSCPLDVDVYHVAHHGSHNGTTEELVRAMSPRIAVISMGPWNRRLSWTAQAYGHPRRRIIDLLVNSEFAVSDPRPDKQVMVGNRSGSRRSAGSGSQYSRWTIDRAVYGTGWDGSVVITADADGVFAVDTEK